MILKNGELQSWTVGRGSNKAIRSSISETMENWWAANLAFSASES